MPKKNRIINTKLDFYDDCPFKIGDKVKMKKLHRIEPPDFDIIISDIKIYDGEYCFSLTNLKGSFSAFVPISQIEKVD